MTIVNAQEIVGRLFLARKSRSQEKCVYDRLSITRQKNLDVQFEATIFFLAGVELRFYRCNSVILSICKQIFVIKKKREGLSMSAILKYLFSAKKCVFVDKRR